MPLTDYTVSGPPRQLLVRRGGVIVGWLSQTRSDGRLMWSLSPAVPVRGGEPPAPTPTAQEALAAWVAWVEG